MNADRMLSRVAAMAVALMFLTIAVQVAMLVVADVRAGVIR